MDMVCRLGRLVRNWAAFFSITQYVFICEYIKHFKSTHHNFYENTHHVEFVHTHLILISGPLCILATLLRAASKEASHNFPGPGAQVLIGIEVCCKQAMISTCRVTMDPPLHVENASDISSLESCWTMLDKLLVQPLRGTSNPPPSCQNRNRSQNIP